MYKIDATHTISAPDGTKRIRVPTFYLDENVQTIVSGHHAQQVARDILTCGQVHIHDSVVRIHTHIDVQYIGR